MTKKCQFFVREVELCGHILGNGTRRPAPGKLKAVEKWELPMSITALRAFLGFTNYYSSYIEKYADLTAPMHEKLKVPREEGRKGSKKKIEWSKADIEAFERLKQVLCSKFVLQRVNPDKPFVLRVDASGYAAGGALEQLLDEDRAPTVEDVMNKKNCPRSLFVSKTHRRATKLDPPVNWRHMLLFWLCRNGKVGLGYNLF